MVSTSTQCNRISPWQGWAGQINFFTIHWLAKCFCATEIPARIMCLSVFLLIAELGTPVLSEGASDAACTAPKNSAVLGNTKGICNRDLFVLTHPQKNDSSIALEARGDLQIWKRVLWCTSTKHSQAQVWKNDYSASRSILTRFAQLLSNMLKRLQTNIQCCTCMWMSVPVTCSLNTCIVLTAL